MSRRMKKWIIGVCIVVVSAIIGGVATYFYFQPKDVKELSVDEAMASIERHMVLPQDEKPAFLTIIDKKKVNSEFLKKAEDGDKVLVYQNNQRVIIYRPSIDRIVDVGFVTIDDSRSAIKRFPT